MKTAKLMQFLQIIQIPLYRDFLQFIKTAKLLPFFKLQFIKTAKLLQLRKLQFLKTANKLQFANCNYKNGQIIALLQIIKIPLYRDCFTIYANSQIVAIYKNGQNAKKLRMLHLRAGWFRPI
jgi:hypothetical protein